MGKWNKEMRTPYSKVESKLRQVLELKKQAQELNKKIARAKETYESDCIAYRIEYVNNILDFVRTQYRADNISNIVDLDSLLCHCQNKLNGNLDTIELDLERFLREKE